MGLGVPTLLAGREEFERSSWDAKKGGWLQDAHYCSARKEEGKNLKLSRREGNQA